MAREDPHFRLRLPADLKARVEDAARKANRSINAEIVAALEEKFPAPLPLFDSIPVDARLSDWAARYEPIGALAPTPNVSKAVGVALRREPNITVGDFFERILEFLTTPTKQ